MWNFKHSIFLIVQLKGFIKSSEIFLNWKNELTSTCTRAQSFQTKPPNSDRVSDKTCRKQNN